MIRKEIEQKFGNNALYDQGLVIKTTLNRDYQKKAAHLFSTHIKQLRTAIRN